MALPAPVKTSDDSAVAEGLTVATAGLNQNHPTKMFLNFCEREQMLIDVLSC